MAFPRSPDGRGPVRMDGRPLAILCGLLLSASASGVPIQADWTGGVGAFEAPAFWSFSAPPVSATFPNNADGDTFSVAIDGGLATDSVAALSSTVTLDALSIGTGDRLEIAPAGTLTLVEDATIENEGVVAVQGGTLSASGELAISGSGVIDLQGAGARITSSDGQFLNVTIGSEQTLTGSGTLELLPSSFSRGLLTNEGLVEVGAGDTLDLQGNLENFGVVRIDGGGRLESGNTVRNRGTFEVLGGAALDLSAGVASFNNTGALTLSGAGTTGDMGLSNSGSVLVSDGAVLNLSTVTQFASSASLRIGSGGLLRFDEGGQLAAGSLVLDGGRVESGNFLRVANLLGSGSVEFTSASNGRRGFEVFNLSPGIDGIGRIEVDGNLAVRDSYEVQLAGTAVGDYDQTLATGSVTVPFFGEIRVSLVDGFALTAGNRFEILTGGSISVAPTQLDTVVTGIDLGDGFFFDAELIDASGTQSIVLSAVERIVATWVGGSGDYGEASQWSFDRPAVNATVPDNDALNLFDVQIDGGLAGGSEATLDGSAQIGRLSVAGGDSLVLGAGASLTLVETTGRDESGVVTNDGTLRLEGATLFSEHDLDLEGDGVVELSDDAANLISSTGATANARATIAADQTVRGAGSIAYAFLTNLGSIEGTGTEALRVDAFVTTNRGTLRATGSGGLQLAGNLSNSGLVEVLSGSSLRMLDPDHTFTNRDTLRLSGAGAFADLRLTNTSRVEVLDGARLSLTSVTQREEDAVMLVGSGAELDFLGFAELFRGRLVLDGGSVSGRGILRLFQLEGSGSVEVSPSTTSRELRVTNLSPGIDGTGFLDITGPLSLEGFPQPTLLVDLAGTDVGAFDQVRVSGEATLDDGSTITLSLLDGFAPASGDHFDLLVASSILLPDQPLASLFTGPALGGDRFFVADRVNDGGSQALRLGVADLVQASWLGGDGRFTDGRWSFDGVPNAAATPDNDLANVFDVSIGGTAGVLPSQVLLDAPARIGRLAVGADDELQIAGPGRLTLAQPLGREDSGRVQNDGTIHVENAALVAEGDLQLAGSGVVELSDAAGNFLGSATGATTRMEIGAGQTLRGAGTVGLNPVFTNPIFDPDFVFDEQILNRGTVEATGTNALVLETNQVVNEGTIRALGSGGLTFFNRLENQGLVEVGAGSRLEGFRFDNEGTLRFRGAGSSTELNSLTHFGLLEILDGARLDTSGISSFSLINGSSTRIRQAELALQDEVLGGTITLEDGTISSTGNLRLVGELRGNGSILVPNGELEVDGVLTPGLSGAGEIEIQGDLRLDDQTLAIQLGGLVPSVDHDVLTVLGTSVLDGVIAISYIPGAGGPALFLPRSGDFFDILSATDIVIERLSFQLPGLPGALGWRSELLATGGGEILRLMVVPEPASAGLLLMGLAALARARRRVRRQGDF